MSERSEGQHGTPQNVEFRPMRVADLAELLVLQERGSVAALSHLFPQETHPFPRDAVRERWEAELREPDIAAHVVTAADARLVGFAARREDELLHFGTALETWGSGLAAWLHDELVATYPVEVTRLRLRVFEGNARARRFYERLGWRATGDTSTSPFAPHPTLLGYALDRVGREAAR